MIHLGALGRTWMTWTLLDSFGLHSDSLGLAWTHLDSVGLHHSVCNHSGNDRRSATIQGVVVDLHSSGMFFEELGLGVEGARGCL